MKLTRRQMRDLGILLALSLPASGFLSFAIFSIAFGEIHFENSDGLTWLGYGVAGMPVVVGLAVAAWAQFGNRLPSRMHIAAAVGTFAVVCLALGGWSATWTDDASIGGGLLILAGVPIGLAAIALFASARRAVRSIPPPPEGVS